MTTPTPGVYHSVPMADYHAWDAASNSRLGKLARSPAHCRVAIDGAFHDTEALVFGRAAHAAILEPEVFESVYAQAAQCNAQTKQSKRCSKMGTVALQSGYQFCGIHAKDYADDRSGVELLSPTDWHHCLGMRDAVHAIGSAHRMIEGLEHVEVSVRWDDKGSGVACKARWDGVAEFAGGCILDLKTTQDAAPRAFERSIFQYGYHRQGAMYLEAADAHGIPARHYVIVAVEKVPPYGTAIYRLTEGAIEAGADQVRGLLARYGECLASGEWRGYSEDVTDIGLPAWAWNQLESQP